MKKIWTGFIILVLMSTVSFPAGKKATTSDDRSQTLVTVYNSDLGVVKEIRDFELSRGRVKLQFEDVASKIKPETVQIKSLKDQDSLKVLEQNYEYDLLSPQKLLDKYVGEKVKIVRRHPKTDEKKVREAKVLSTNNGTVLKIGNEITYNYDGRITFPEIPDNLIAKPTLIWLLENRIKDQKVETSYMTSGMTWEADYVVQLGENDETADLNGWVTLDNTSGTTFENVRLKLVAGDVHRADERKTGRRVKMMEAAPARSKQFKEESFFEYHLYTLDRKTNLKNNQKKQVSLLEASDIKVDKRYILRGQRSYYRGSRGNVPKQKIGVFLDIPNKEKFNLGTPLPKGTVRVHKADSDGNLQFIGEDNIDHTPKDETLHIKMGKAFDITAERKQTDYSRIANDVYESAWEVEIRNHKEKPVTIEVIEPVHGDWEIINSTHEARKVDAFTLKFPVSVPADGKSVLRYRVRVRY